jgi:hypothetical protein
MDARSERKNAGHEPRRHWPLRNNDRRYSASVSMPLLYAALISSSIFPDEETAIE